MKNEIRRLDYQAPAFTIRECDLVFALDFDCTEVTSVLRIERLDPATRDCFLHGEELELLDIALNGQALSTARYATVDGGLVLREVPDRFELRTTVRIAPAKNTRLEGLYRSGNFLLTQCEAEGFRRITYFIDRPDVMAIFRVGLIADPALFPVLLANGNPLEEVRRADGRLESRWFDPHPKPSYLFAIAAGQLEYIEDWYTTADAREVRLRIYSEPNAIARCQFAMGAVKRAMQWDEQRFGRCYDLDVFNIVATHDFNMGAMENKGLNIFNAKYIVADETTATDTDFEGVEAVIGHEYFHNWTGNRITCRDWFQLSLKEGLTVFRDQEFTADLHSRAIKRIDDVKALRANQFPEDSGPFAHPVRPEQYVEINNFYTMTVYEKGAEVVRLYQTLLGRAGFRAGMDLYFARHDGQAVTCDDFRAAMADANGVNLDAFERWYLQAGTPMLEARGEYHQAQREWHLHLRQHTPDTPGQSNKLPQIIPVQLMLYDHNGSPMALHLRADAAHSALHHALQQGVAEPSTQRTLVFDQAGAVFVFDAVACEPVASLLQNFSAPVRLQFTESPHALALRARCDHDAFNRWDAMQRLAELAIHARYESRSDAAQWQTAWQDAATQVLGDQTLDPALSAELIGLPDFAYLSDIFENLDPSALLVAVQALESSWVQVASDLLQSRYQALHALAGSDWNAGQRRLQNRLLLLLARHAPASGHALAHTQYAGARNMSERAGALHALVQGRALAAREALGDFRARFSNDALVLDKWFALQASDPSDHALERVQSLMDDAAFSITNPNKVRSLIGGFARLNPQHFHASDGSGYAFVRTQIETLDDINPQIAARLGAVFNAWRRLEPGRRDLMHAQLKQLQGAVQSADVREIVERALAMPQ